MSEQWYSAIKMMSKLTKSNLDKVPIEEYEWNLFGFPLKALDTPFMLKKKLRSYNSQKSFESNEE